MDTIILQQTDPAILEVATIILQEQFHVIALEQFPKNIVNLVHTSKAKLVILDFILDGKEAIQVLQRLRKNYANLPVIALSCDRHIDEKALQYGFNGAIEKPFNIEAVTKLVHQLIKPKTLLTKPQQLLTMGRY